MHASAPPTPTPCTLVVHFHYCKSGGTTLRQWFANSNVSFHPFSRKWPLAQWGDPAVRAREHISGLAFVDVTCSCVHWFLG